MPGPVVGLGPAVRRQGGAGAEALKQLPAYLPRDPDDADLLNIVFGHGRSWTDVKAAAEITPEDVPLKRMTQMRRRVVDALIDEQRQTFNVGVKSVGSDSATSDYDITFLRDFATYNLQGSRAAQKWKPTPGAVAKPEEAVVTFNRRFNQVFGTEPGWFFDTNVYAEDFLFAPTTLKGAVHASALRDDEATTMDGAGQRHDAVMQDRNALVKIRKNMSVEAWASMTAAVLEGLDDLLVKTNTKRQFVDADNVYLKTYVPGILAGLPPDVLAGLRAAHPDLSEPALADEAVGSTSQGFAASNRAYERSLLGVAKLTNKQALLRLARPQGDTGLDKWQSDCDELTLQIREAKSQALLFANEPYFSAGTLYHVVGGIQGEGGRQKERDKRAANPEAAEVRETALDLPTLFQSLNENYGDFLKEERHTAKHSAPTPEADAARAIKCSKYFYRFYDAASRMTAVDPALDTIATAEGLQLAGRLAMAKQLFGLRQGVAAPALAEGEAAPDAAALKKATADTAAAAMAAVDCGSMELLAAELKRAFILLNKNVRKRGQERDVSANRGSIRQ